MEIALSYGANTGHKFLQLPNDTLFTYNLWDAYCTARLYQALRRELRDAGPNQQQYYDRWTRPLIQSVRRMQRRGLLVDREARKTYRQRAAMELFSIDEEIRRRADTAGFRYTDKFPNSDTQVASLLFDTLGLRPAGRTDSGRPSVDQTNLLRVLRDLRKKDEEHRGLLLDLLHRSRLQTIWERYLSFSPDSDGRLRATIKMTGTKTFRYAVSNPALQQFPPEVRHMFVAPAGKFLVQIDYSQLEARILALLSGDPISLRAFSEGRDIHWQNALDLLGLDAANGSAMDATRRKAARGLAKGFLYRISYGGEGATDKTKFFCPCHRCLDKVPPTLDLGKAEILAAEERWFDKHSEVRRWQRELLAKVRRNHYYDSPLGLRRWIAARWSRDLEREVKNIPMQMNAALLMNQSQVLLDQKLSPVPETLFQLHDSFLFEIPNSPGSLVDQTIADLRGIMERPVPELGSDGFPADVELGENWGSRSAENPNGLEALCP